MIEIQSGAAITEPVFVQTADDTEYQLIRTAQEAANSGNWIVGECACRWLHTYAKGRTDEQFGELIGLSRTQVQQRRQVWETFGKTYYRHENLTWSHFRDALQWEDAEECLAWADSQAATCKEMALWRQVQRGELGGGKCHARDTSSENTGKTAQKPQSAPKPQGRTIHTSVPSRSDNVAAKNVVSEAITEPAQKPEPEQDPTTVMAMALRKIDEMLSFVISQGTEQDRAALLSQLRTIVNLLDPKEACEMTTEKPAKSQKVQASLAVANAVVEEWNMVDGVLRCKAVTPKRRHAIGVRMKDPFWREHWREAIDKIRGLPCLHGTNDRNWQADIDWFLRPDTVALVIEGKYDNWRPSGKKGAARIRTQPQGEIRYDD